MMNVRKVLTFSNVTAFIALFVALGGSVYAAGKISGTQIKANSIPGNRVKAKTLTGNQIKPGSLTGTQIQAGSLPGTQIKAGSIGAPQIQAGSLTGTQVDQSSLTSVTASKISSIAYATSTIALTGVTVNQGTANCPAGTNVIGGGATVSNPNLDLLIASGPSGSRNGWTATAEGEPGTSMTVTAICTAAAGVTG